MYLLETTGQDAGVFVDTWTSARTEEIRQAAEKQERVEREALEKVRAAEAKRLAEEEELRRRMRLEEELDLEEDMENEPWYKQMMKPKAPADRKAQMQVPCQSN